MKVIISLFMIFILTGCLQRFSFPLTEAHSDIAGNNIYIEPANDYLINMTIEIPLSFLGVLKGPFPIHKDISVKIVKNNYQIRYYTVITGTKYYVYEASETTGRSWGLLINENGKISEEYILDNSADKYYKLNLSSPIGNDVQFAILNK